MSSRFSVCGRVLSVLACCFLSPVVVNAITLDDFSGQQILITEAPNGLEVEAVSVPNAIGGTRALSTEVTGGTQGFLNLATTSTPPHRLSHSQGDGISGVSRIHWDGDLDPNTVAFTGLGCVDLTQDGSTALVLQNLNFDFAFGSAVSFTLTVFDGSDPTGSTFSSFEQVLTQQVIGGTVSFLYSTPTATGAGGAADFTCVGAIELVIDGSNPGIDLSFELLATNGECPLVPDANGSVYDECGECLPPTDPGYNMSCIDCEGTPNGTVLPGTECTTGTPGICDGGTLNAQCECEQNFEPGTELCDGVDNDCDGEIDETFPELGEVCGAGEGECKVEGEYTCDDNGGLQCDADFDLLDLSDCSDIIGCDGIPGSPLVLDICGICGGDGSACDGCTGVDITAIQFELDGGAKLQEKLIRKGTRRLRKVTKRKRITKLADEIDAIAHDLQITNWVLSWTLPNVLTQCPTSEFCVTTSNEGTLTEYRDGSRELKDLGLQTVRRIVRATKSRGKLVRRLRKQMKQAHDDNLARSEEVPLTYTACTFSVQ